MQQKMQKLKNKKKKQKIIETNEAQLIGTNINRAMLKKSLVMKSDGNDK
jgi:hypothetical protein